MPFPEPTERQSKLLWAALTGVAVAILAGLAGLAVWAVAWIANQLSAVLLPLAVAGVIAYLLDPIVDFLEARRVARMRAILLGFTLGVTLALLLIVTLVPRLVVEASDLVEQVPSLVSTVNQSVVKWLAETPRAMKAKEFWDAHAGNGPCGERRTRPDLPDDGAARRLRRPSRAVRPRKADTASRAERRLDQSTGNNNADISIVGGGSPLILFENLSHNH